MRALLDAIRESTTPNQRAAAVVFPGVWLIAVVWLIVATR